MSTDHARAEPRIYVASLADYNAGRIHGKWIDPTNGLDETRAAIATMLQESREPGAEEWAIHDHEGFDPLRMREFASLTWVADVAAGIKLHGEAFAAWEAHLNHGREPASHFDSLYLGYWLPSATEGDMHGLVGDQHLTLIPATGGGFYAFCVTTPADRE